MNLDRVTVTGADDSVEPADLAALSAEFPFVEWGILLSRSQEGSQRFPSLSWMLRLREKAGKGALVLSGHLCGAWVRELCAGKATFNEERPDLRGMFDRMQLNFHSSEHEYKPTLLSEALGTLRCNEFIFQHDGVNDAKMDAVRRLGVRTVPLFDTSGGAGVEPGSWPSPVGNYCGYAGGLHPDRLTAQLERIAEAAGNSRIWIDVETHVRSADDARFDLAKVRRFLEAAAPFVASGGTQAADADGSGALPVPAHLRRTWRRRWGPLRDAIEKESRRAAEDWTRGPDGRSNCSPEFERLACAVERLILDSAHDLIAGRVKSVAGLIMAQLAHKHGLRPPRPVTEAEED